MRYLRYTPSAGRLVKALMPWLLKSGIQLTVSSIDNILDDMATRLMSAQVHWADVAWRDTLLMPCVEEAAFYEPQGADLEIRALVVLVVRNSIIENIHSQPGELWCGVTDAFMPLLTRFAIELLADSDLGESMHTVVDPPSDFDLLPLNYPRAWAAFGALATGATSWQLSDWAQQHHSHYVVPGQDQSGVAQVAHRAPVVESGVSPFLSHTLQDMLVAVKEGRQRVLFVDSFKALTRNHQKLFYVVDQMLEHDGQVVTHNYLLEPGLALCRRPLLPPMHSMKDLYAKFAFVSDGTTPQHREVLEQMSALVGGH